MIRLLIVDDHKVVRQGLRFLLQHESDIDIVAEAADGEQAIALVRQHVPAVVLLDLLMPKMDGLTALRTIKEISPSTQVIILTSHQGDEELFDAIKAGALSYVLKTAGVDVVVESVRAAARGESLLDPAVTRKVLMRVRESKVLERDAKLASLTPREEQVLELLATGMTNAQIGREIHISDKTVKNHVSTILGKLEVGRRTEAAAYVAQHRNPFG